MFDASSVEISYLNSCWIEVPTWKRWRYASLMGLLQARRPCQGCHTLLMDQQVVNIHLQNQDAGANLLHHNDCDWTTLALASERGRTLRCSTNLDGERSRDTAIHAMGNVQGVSSSCQHPQRRVLVLVLALEARTSVNHHQRC